MKFLSKKIPESGMSWRRWVIGTASAFGLIASIWLGSWLTALAFALNLLSCVL